MEDVFFAIQVAVKAPPHDPWRKRLASLVRSHVRDLPLRDKRGLYGSLANLLEEAADRCVLGFWDFVPDGRGDYDDWVRGIEDDSAEPWVQDRGAPLDYVLVSAMFLLQQDGAAATVAGERCDVPPSEWAARATWRHLFATLPMLDAASVRGDAIYVVPGGDREAFSLRELQGEGYDYLVPIE